MEYCNLFDCWEHLCVPPEVKTIAQLHGRLHYHHEGYEMKTLGLWSMGFRCSGDPSEVSQPQRDPGALGLLKISVWYYGIVNYTEVFCPPSPHSHQSRFENISTKPRWLHLTCRFNIDGQSSVYDNRILPKFPSAASFLSNNVKLDHLTTSPLGQQRRTLHQKDKSHELQMCLGLFVQYQDQILLDQRSSFVQSYHI